MESHQHHHVSSATPEHLNVGGLSILDFQSPNIASQKREVKMQNRGDHNGYQNASPVPLDIEFKAAPSRAINGHVNALLAQNHTQQPAHHDSDEDVSSPLAMPNGISNGMPHSGMISNGIHNAIHNGMAPKTFQMDQVEEHDDADLVPSHNFTNSGRRNSVPEAESDTDLPQQHEVPSR